MEFEFLSLQSTPARPTTSKSCYEEEIQLTLDKAEQEKYYGDSPEGHSPLPELLLLLSVHYMR